MLSRFTVPALALLVTTLGALPASAQEICFCFTADSDPPAPGGRHGVSVHSADGGNTGPVWADVSGDSPNQAAAELGAALFAAGCSVTVTDNCVCVSASGGSATTGAGHMETSPTGLDLTIQRGADKPGKVAVGGGPVQPLLPGEPTAVAPGSVEIMIEINVLGITLRIRIKIDVSVGETRSGIQNRMWAALQSNGFLVNQVVVPDPFNPGQLVNMWSVSQDATGHQVESIRYRFDVPGLDGPLMTAIGIDPLFGTTHFGAAFDAGSGQVPVLSALHTPRIGQPLSIKLRSGAPGRPCTLLLGFAETSVPLFMFDPEAVLLVVPSVTVSGVSGPDGAMTLPLAVPLDQALVGLRLHWQGADVGAFPIAPLRLSAGMMTAIGP